MSNDDDDDGIDGSDDGNDDCYAASATVVVRRRRQPVVVDLWTLADVHIGDHVMVCALRSSSLLASDAFPGHSNTLRRSKQRCVLGLIVGRVGVVCHRDETASCITPSGDVQPGDS